MATSVICGMASLSSSSRFANGAGDVPASLLEAGDDPGGNGVAVAGIEDCTKTSGLDKRTGCLQSNVNFLQRLVTKNALDFRQKLDEAAAEIVTLKGVVTRLQKTVEQLEAAQKAASPSYSPKIA
jgi:outer membrane murein-binding lipoprotein Lpp